MEVNLRHNVHLPTSKDFLKQPVRTKVRKPSGDWQLVKEKKEGEIDCDK